MSDRAGAAVKLALVVPGGVDRSGTVRVIPALLALIERLAARHELHVYALRQEARPATWDLAGARVHNIGVGWTRVRAVHAICAEHRRSPFHLVQSVWAGACGLVAVAASRLLRIPSAVHVAGGELVRLPDIAYGGCLTWRGRLQEKVVLAGASALTAASVPMVSTLATYGRSAQRLPLGVDLRRWPMRPPAQRGRDEPLRLVHVASLNRVKDQPTLLRALALLSSSGVPFQADIVGEDTLGGEIQALARTLGLLERVGFRGFVPHGELQPIVSAAHLMIVSSRHEAGPLAMLEAAALGVPTVGTAVGHVAEWAPEAALAVPVGDCVRLAAAIRVVASDEALRQRLARAAQQLACQEDADHTAQRFQRLYAQLGATAPLGAPRG
jgi:glycosyltransferase involved in cell wall biosynthesis